MKGYLSIREAAEKWGVSQRRINQYCSQGRIPGAERFWGPGPSRGAENPATPADRDRRGPGCPQSGGPFSGPHAADEHPFAPGAL